MKRLNLLKTIVDIIWYLSIPTLFIFVGFVLYMSWTGQSFTKTLYGSMITLSGFKLVVVLCLNFITYGLLVFSLFLFRKVLQEFKQLQLFNQVVIALLLRIGKLVIASGILMFISKFLTNYWSFNQITLSLSPNDLLIYGGIGAFFLVLSEVFDRARLLKEENELTV
ncbi:DUF2975 domain-containing protein [Gilvibacter sediminis]|uniref:DUF2975 domain-containing protein n=1 Tax=Gilvibacter sediminis TaxID=379071 RepID=UPI0023500035|nr:DUF2975 domain-containing protein [Gilvibacter sediminis]MDC7997131.1 DUF2975 domain-containing protein [Gilvibacter sediminis]